MEQAIKTPWHLWVVGIATLLFNAIGCYSYTMTQTGSLADLGMTPDQIAYFDGFPAWADAAWALGVWGAFTGSVLLLLRRKLALAAFVVATIGLIATTYFELVVSQIPDSLQNPALMAAIWISTLFSLWYSRWMGAAGVLR
ncbi:MAG: hypothetical protein V7664_00825 [Qipengyuania sp.]|uniref:hypothetical protein n=1 Tax=Qipengyuania sp. TaxID=2004515 RepID=UPI003001700B